MFTRRAFVAGVAAAGAAVAVGPMPAAGRDRSGGRRRDVLIRGGTVVTMDPETGVLDSADVLVRDGVVSRVARRIDSSRGAEIIDASGMIVLPGYVNVHTHFGLVPGLSSDATPQSHRDNVLVPLPAKLTVEDVYYGTLVGALDAMSRGSTTVLNWDLDSLTLAHAKAAVDALADAGVRALHSFSTAQPNQNDPDSAPTEEDFRAIVEYMRRYPLVSPHMGARNPTNRPDSVLAVVKRSFEIAEELDLTISMHAGLITSRETPALLEREGMLSDRVTFMNGSAFTDVECELVAARGAWISTAPEVEQITGTPVPFGPMFRAGLRPVVCTDSIAHIEPDMATQIRVFRNSARAEGISTERGPLTLEDAFAYGNVNPAESLRMSDTIGSLSVGKAADIVLINPGSDTLPVTDVFSDLLHFSAHNVDTVLVAGRIVKRRGQLVGHDLPALRRKARRLQEQLLAR